MEGTLLEYQGDKFHRSNAKRHDMWPDFYKFHFEHPNVWIEFVRYCFVVLRKNFKRYSAHTLVGVVRFEVDIERATGEEFKIANANSSYYARMFSEIFETYYDFFRFTTVTINNSVLRSELHADMVSRVKNSSLMRDPMFVPMTEVFDAEKMSF